MHKIFVGFLVSICLFTPVFAGPEQDSAAVFRPKAKGEPHKVIVVLKDEPLLRRSKLLGKNLTPQQVRTAWKNWDQEILARQNQLLDTIRTKKPVDVKHFRKAINAMAMTIPFEAVVQLSADERVAGVFPDTQVVGNLETSAIQVQATQAWNRVDPGQTFAGRRYCDCGCRLWH